MFENAEVNKYTSVQLDKPPAVFGFGKEYK
jgi:hypothetical protein